jgi:DNA-3-methyladenine glycosylase II
MKSLSPTPHLEERLEFLRCADPVLADLLDRMPELHYPLYGDGFAFLAKTIISQMLSKTAATAICTRFAALCENCVTPDAILNLGLKRIVQTGASHAKANFLLDISAYVLRNPDFLARLQDEDDSAVVMKLTTLKGIGPWTSKMYLIFVLDRQDIVPCEDGAFRQALRRFHGLACEGLTFERLCAKWSPYASVAARLLYQAFDSGLIPSMNGKRK